MQKVICGAGMSVLLVNGMSAEKLLLIANIKHSKAISRLRGARSHFLLNAIKFLALDRVARHLGL